jgi:hypothetical protein
MIRDAVVTPFPSFATVSARMNGTEKCAGEDRSACLFECDRAYILAAQGALGFMPFSTVFSLEKHQSVLGSHPELF